MDSPLQDKESYFYIQENYNRIVEELGDNLESYDDGEGYWIVDIKYKRKED
jgi:hypothetical protein